MIKMNNFTPYPDINGILFKFKEGIKETLKKRVFGIYIHGSLALGDFNPNSSDIDFLVVTKNPLSEDDINSLREFHLNMETKYPKWWNRLEGSYIPKDILKRLEPPDIPRPYLNNGKLMLAKYGYEWILEKYVLREYGIVLDGPPFSKLVDPIESKDLKRATLNLLHEWWKPMIYDTDRLYDTEYQVYAVLTMCRVLYTLNHGKIVSKPKAAQWVKEKLNHEKRKQLIESALKWYEGKNMNFDHPDETVDFIRFVLGYSQEKFS